jgi:hypothetical protein
MIVAEFPSRSMEAKKPLSILMIGVMRAFYFNGFPDDVGAVGADISDNLCFIRVDSLHPHDWGYESILFQWLP